MTDPFVIPEIIIPEEVTLMLTEKTQEYKLKHRYGLTLEDYNYLLYHQGFRCKVCGIDRKQYGQPFHVDHCHETGIVRGLLCSNCNTGLGLFQEDQSILAKAIIYLNNFHASNN